jgi:hypothetical protein
VLLGDQSGLLQFFHSVCWHVCVLS